MKNCNNRIYKNGDTFTVKIPVKNVSNVEALGVVVYIINTEGIELESYNIHNSGSVVLSVDENINKNKWQVGDISPHSEIRGAFTFKIVDDSKVPYKIDWQATSENQDENLTNNVAGVVIEVITVDGINKAVVTPSWTEDDPNSFAYIANKPVLNNSPTNYTIVGNTIPLHFDGIDQKLGDIGNDITNIQGNITNIEGDITNIESNITNIEGDITNIQEGLSSDGYMLKSEYDTDEDGKVESAGNADTVNNLTVETAVPPGAVFTDDQRASEVPTDITGANYITDNANTEDSLIDLDNAIKNTIDNLGTTSHDEVTLDTNPATTEGASLFGQQLTLFGATTSSHGFMSPSDKDKLNNIEHLAKDDQLASEVPTNIIGATYISDYADTEASLIQLDTAISNIVLNGGGSVNIANVLFVSKNGNNSSAIKGSLEFTWRDPWNAINSAADGDTIIVFPGNYTYTYIGNIDELTADFATTESLLNGQYNLGSKEVSWYFYPRTSIEFLHGESNPQPSENFYQFLPPVFWNNNIINSFNVRGHLDIINCSNLMSLAGSTTENLTNRKQAYIEINSFKTADGTNASDSLTNIDAVIKINNYDIGILDYEYHYSESNVSLDIKNFKSSFMSRFHTYEDPSDLTTMYSCSINIDNLYNSVVEVVAQYNTVLTIKNAVYDYLVTQNITANSLFTFSASRQNSNLKVNINSFKDTSTNLPILLNTSLSSGSPNGRIIINIDDGQANNSKFIQINLNNADDEHGYHKISGNLIGGNISLEGGVDVTYSTQYVLDLSDLKLITTEASSVVENTGVDPYVIFQGFMTNKEVLNRSTLFTDIGVEYFNSNLK